MSRIEKPGTYLARCLGAQHAQWGESQAGNLQLALPFVVTSGENEGATITWFGTFKPGKSTELALDALEACGWRGDDPTASLGGVESDEVELVVELDENGRLRVQWVNRPGGGVRLQKPVAGAALRQLGAHLRGAVVERRRAQGAPHPARPAPQRPPPARQAPPPASADDDHMGYGDYGGVDADGF